MKEKEGKGRKKRRKEGKKGKGMEGREGSGNVDLNLSSSPYSLCDLGNNPSEPLFLNNKMSMIIKTVTTEDCKISI